MHAAPTSPASTAPDRAHAEAPAPEWDVRTLRGLRILQAYR